MHLFALATALTLLAPGGPLLAGNAATHEDRRTIAVSGDAEVKVAPDEVAIHLGVESRDKDLGKAKRENDDLMKKVIAAARAAGVEEERIATDRVSIEPHHDSNQRWILEGYTVRRSVQMTLRDLSRFDAVLAAAIGAGANFVHGIDFTTTELRKHRDEARARAMKAAQEKAVALAKELGMKPGRARAITEGGGGLWGGYGWWGGHGRGGGVSQNVSLNVGQGGAVEGTMAPGMVSVTASVSVVFDLE